jgi:UV DNA damage endonuclease
MKIQIFDQKRLEISSRFCFDCIQYIMSNFRYGLCCIHLGLADRDYKFQTMTRKRYLELGNAAHALIADRALNNVNVTERIATACHQAGWVYRVSSGIMPLVTLPDASFTFDSIVDILSSRFTAACVRMRAVVDSGLRISNHPDQFNVLASDNSAAVDKTIRELDTEARTMTMLGARNSYESPMNIHINCSKGNIQDIADRFAANLVRLGDAARNRLVVENEDKGVWTVENLHKYIYLRTGTPITFDYLHHKCNPGNLSEQQAFELAASTWHGYRPLFHYSESMPNQNNSRKHADYPTVVFDTYGVDVDVDMEFKMKDAAIKRHTVIMENNHAAV